MPGLPILVVDDNALNRKLLGVLLSREGYEVHLARDGEHMFELLQSIEPSLVLMDVHMPGEDGIALTRRLKADPGRAHIPVVAVTADLMRSTKNDALEAGCAAFVGKPIDIATMRDLVRDLVSA